MKNSLFSVIIIIFGIMVTSCSQPPRKTPPEGGVSCTTCSGTGKAPLRLGSLKFYYDCPECNGNGYIIRFGTVGVSPVVIDGVDEPDDGDYDEGGSSYDGGYDSPSPQPVQVWVDCYDCHGSRECSSCNGDGWDISTYSDGSYNTTYKCPVCYGTGNCQHCMGTGGHYETQLR